MFDVVLKHTARANLFFAKENFKFRRTDEKMWCVRGEKDKSTSGAREKKRSSFCPLKANDTVLES